MLWYSINCQPVNTSLCKISSSCSLNCHPQGEVANSTGSYSLLLFYVPGKNSQTKMDCKSSVCWECWWAVPGSSGGGKGDLPCKSYLLHLGKAPLGKAIGDKILLSINGLVHAKSLRITGKTRALFISFGSKPVLTISLRSRTTFLPGEMECLQAWKKKFKKKTKNFISPLHTKCISLWQTSQAICQKSHIWRKAS